MNDLVIVSGGQAVTTTLVIGEETGNEHASVILLARKYLADLEEFGPCRFEIAKGTALQQGGFAKPTEYALLNEQQATLLMTYMRNSDKVREFKKRLVRAFWQMAQQLAGAEPRASRARAEDPYKLIRGFLAIGREVSRVPGVNKAMAMALTLQTIEEETGLPANRFRPALPALPREQIANLNPTRVGERVGISARAVNTSLVGMGLQTKDEKGEWRLTEAGEKFGEAIPFTARSGHSEYQVMWRETVLEPLRKFLGESKGEAA